MFKRFDAAKPTKDSAFGTLTEPKTTAKPDQKWGNWRFDAERLVLVFERADWAGLNLELDVEVGTSSQLLDRLFQLVRGRVGAVFTAQDVADLLEAIEDVVNPQATLCSCGTHKKLEAKKFFGDVQAEALGDSAEGPKTHIGKWFHSHHKDGSPEWQGQIIGQSKSRVRVQLYEWGFGYPSDKVSVPAVEIDGWTLYNTNREMREAGNAYLATLH